MKVLLHAHRWTEEMYTPIIEKFPDITFAIPGNDADLEKEITDTQILFGSITGELFAMAEKLEWIQYNGSGVNWVFSVPELIQSSIPVTNTRGAQAETIAEHTIGLLIALARGFYPLFIDQHNHHWRRPLIQPAIGLSGLSMGILGFGAIGQAVSRLAAAFNIDIYTCDVRKPDHIDKIKQYFPLDKIEDFLKAVNILVVTVPFTPETESSLGLQHFRLLKKPSYVIAVSRGGIIREHELMRALEEKILNGAALDVQLQKPVPPESPLWQTPNLLITPHCSGESKRTDDMVADIFIKNLAHYLNGEPLINIINKERGF